ncbi:FMN-dependent NADH-azoreductase [Aliikangiella sp. IMCC44632]
MSQSILLINSSGRYANSVTRNVAQQVSETLSLQNPNATLVKRDTAAGLPFVNEQWISANFTPQQERTEQDLQTLSLSDQLVTELKRAQHLIIASPIYNFSIPASLKSWIDLIARARLTFRYTENGPEGLLKGKKAYLVMASGGVPIESSLDFATNYLKQIMSFIGIEDVTVIDANQFNAEQFANQEPEASLAN